MFAVDAPPPEAACPQSAPELPDLTFFADAVRSVARCADNQTS
jgi:hypothetical protein